MTGGASGSSSGRGDASSAWTASSWSEADASGSDYSDASGNLGTSYGYADDHYDDQSNWSEPYDALNMSGSAQRR